MSAASRRHALRRWFSLIEVLVTIFVIGASVALYAAAANTITITRNAKYQSIATRVAAHQLEELRALSYASLPESGSFAHSEMDLLPSASGAMDISAYNDKTREVTVTVFWQELGASPRSTSLTTLITESGGL